MNFKVNRKLLPVKVHFFFFFAALGPILPQLNVFGRQLGVSPGVMGLVTAVLPLLWAAAKPLFGYVVDYWPNQRKLVFMLLIVVMTGSYCGLWFIPMPEANETPPETTEPSILEYVYKLNDTVYLEQFDGTNEPYLDRYSCHWTCAKDTNFQVYLTNSTYINTLYLDNAKNTSCSLLHMDLDTVREGETICAPKHDCNLLCFEEELLNTTSNRTKRAMEGISISNNVNSDQNNKMTKDNSSHSDKNVVIKVGNATSADLEQEKSSTDPDRSVTDPNSSTTDPGSSTTDPDRSATDQNRPPTDPNSSITDSNRSVTDPDRSSTDPNSSTTDPNRSSTDPDRSSTDPNRSATDPNRSSTNPNSSTTDPSRSSTDPSSPQTDPNSSQTDPNRSTPTSTEATTTEQIKSIDVSKNTLNTKDIRSKVAKVVHSTLEEDNGSFYMTAAFWTFVVLMCIGTVAFNVANCIGDAVCFDVLGAENASKYGSQRAWGTAGYGVTALLGGWLVDRVSAGATKDWTPVFIVALAATLVDLYSCTHLKLPSLSTPQDSGKALRAVLRVPRVVVFIAFAVLAGTFDSFIIYYMFWFLEELAEQTGHTAQIKLIEGVVVAGQSFIGELLFFALSGKIINRWGYGTTMTLSLFCYGVRMCCISLIQHPWQLVIIESIMQGPTYALCYSTIVGYAAHVAPPGYSATVQGIVAGMDDGVGFALGSLVGGQLYSWAGGRGSFRILAVTAALASVAHAVLFRLVTRTKPELQTPEVPEEGEKMLPLDHHSSAIYRDTVEPLTEKKVTS